MDVFLVVLFIFLYLGVGLYIENKIMSDKKRDEQDKLGPFL
jgi:hypothetical protein